MLEKAFALTYDLNMKIGRIGSLTMEVSRFDSTAQILCNGKSANAKSVLGLMSLEIPAGTPFVLRLDGADEQEAMLALSEILEKSGARQLPPDNDTER